MPTIMFQQEAGPDSRQPWPVVVDGSGEVVHGRPDADWLVGFGPKNSFEVTVFSRDVMKNPELAIGLSPTFTYRGEMFSVSLDVVSCREYAGGEDAVDRLRIANQISRAIYDSEE